MPIERKLLVTSEGKALVSQGQLADPDCCCASCTCDLPDGTCPHSICIEFKLDNNDSSDQDIVELVGGEAAGFGFYFDGSAWQLYGFVDGTASIPAVNPFDTWHSLRIEITATTDDTIHVSFTVDDGDPVSLDMTWHNCIAADDFRVGAFSGSGEAHRTIRKAALHGNPASGEEGAVGIGHQLFCFPDDSFQALVNGAVYDDDGNLRIDSDEETWGSNDCWGDNATNLDMTCICPCPDEGQIRIRVDVDWSTAVDDGDGSFCALHFNHSGSDSQTVCVTPDDWEVDFSHDYSDECPDRSGACGRILDAPDQDYLAGGVTIGVLGLGGEITGNNFWSLNCQPKDSDDCSDALVGPCGDENGSAMTQAIDDPNEPGGNYTFGDSHTETNYSWSWTLNITITKLG